MPVQVSVASGQDDEGNWLVEVRVEGELYDQLPAGSREEARAMVTDLLTMVRESGGQVVHLYDSQARRN